ncbi:hypothetical protein U1Q18_032479, partial [Sarracenia purpurea var. burkii]
AAAALLQQLLSSSCLLSLGAVAGLLVLCGFAAVWVIAESWCSSSSLLGALEVVLGSSR